MVSLALILVFTSLVLRSGPTVSKDDIIGEEEEEENMNEAGVAFAVDNTLLILAVMMGLLLLYDDDGGGDGGGGEIGLIRPSWKKASPANATALVANAAAIGLIDVVGVGVF